MKRVAILGSTGSIGRQTLEVISWHRDKFKVALLAASSNVELLARQAESFGPQKAVILEEDKAPFLASSVGDKAEIGVGLRGLEEAVASVEMDLMVAAMVGIGSLPAVLAALKAGKTVALANKELLVTAGPLVTRTARMGGATLLPVDSEHSAIFQCLEGRNLQEVDRIILTASGGPFRHLSWEEMARVTPEEALRHPTWEMGPKVTVDSATLMNKGLEVIEARHLFDVPYERIEVVIHPQSLVHGLVRFVDGSLLAHLGPADMRLPIQYALSWPERWSSPVRPL
ncbi:MAG TPA: 1-deoxy-D-xylulose-5-phosphate reductoisomerase, partial [Moorella mulderi]|nr:1-deoxy-D-xylulose-5-phosphate reductoisomerase [Moorella mulderi]